MTIRNTAEIPRGSKAFEAKLNAAAKAGERDAIEKEKAAMIKTASGRFVWPVKKSDRNR